MSAQPQTEEISKTIAQLRFETIRESLKFAKCKSIGAKPALVKNYEGAVLDVGIEKFVVRLPEDVVTTTAKLLNLEAGANQNLKDGLTENIQSAGLSTVLGKSDEELLKKFSAALGLEDETPEYAKKIEDEVMLIGMEGFLQNLNPELLRKHCAELNLTKSGTKTELVERLMVHIFELEPLDTKKDAVPTQDKPGDKEKEEAKPKENKKRKAPEPKEKKAGKKTKADEKVDATATQRPKRSAATKKRVDDEADEEKPAKRQKKEPAQKEKPAPKEKKEKTPKEKEVPRTRTPYVAPPLSTIVKGQYSAADLHNKFNLTDLQKYAKQEGLKSSGQKKNIIKRITTYLETGKKEEEKVVKKGKPKAKSAQQKKSGGGKKKATKDDRDKAVPASDSKAGGETQA